MEEKDLELIERHFRNLLNGEEEADFQRRLATDVGFREAVQLHGDALAAIRMEGEAMLRARLTAKGRELDAQPNRRKNRWWLWALPAMLVCAGAIWWAAPALTEEPDIQQTPVPPTSPNPPVETTPSVVPPVKNEPQAPPQQQTREEPKIFASWFHPYKDDTLEPSVRGDAEPSPSEVFQQRYWVGDYRAALDAFDAMGATAQNNDNLLFLKANCLLATGSAGEAVPLLENIIRNDRSRFTAQAPWYLALSRLESGQEQQARALFQSIAADPNSPRQADAIRLLESLK
ncbi:MAG: tetratricopeptide repeat protein [Saprospiraceae bacterium]